MMDRRFPIGQFQQEGPISEEQIKRWIEEISQLPEQVISLVKRLSESELLHTYREGGWNIKQIVHHIADSHLNSFIRFKLALTEENPIIKPYEEAEWAKLPDYDMPPQFAFELLASIHRKWVVLLRSLTAEQLERTFQHPESGEVSLKENIEIYAWHGKHHLAHIRLALVSQD
ncbi:YfiT family bacillithiol transferase [Terribacillus saccharophilus]|uniref:Putative metal-dependent hydrolase CHH64_01505 n=1 Tax=Terribacillus saccharophilus TaxID=361277 RepID=A0A268AE80_9BACI|nr:putative metal-dependent hydrolase [Terribacillus saccharophilus]PAD22414.1 metal-dependent hydrolase [Terribacillus saccharophilus]